jgi:hypothetical protein
MGNAVAVEVEANAVLDTGESKPIAEDVDEDGGLKAAGVNINHWLRDVSRCHKTHLPTPFGQHTAPAIVAKWVTLATAASVWTDTVIAYG